MSDCVVFYESWQMECCGNRFEIGDKIKWIVCKCNTLNTPVEIDRLEYYYEAHSSDWKNLFLLEGKVEAIQILYQKYEPLEENPKLLVPVSGILIDSKFAEGFDKSVDGMEAGGYVAKVSNYLVRPAKMKEVIFK